MENPTIASTANRIILRSGYFVRPAWRAARVYVTPVCLKPIHENIPRTYLLLSRICRNASSAFRSTSRKSPTSIGWSRSLSRRSRR